MSELTAQAFGTEGVRGFVVTNALTKAELIDELRKLPENASRWTEWTSATLVVKTGRGRTKRTLTASANSLADVERFAEETLAAL